MIWLLTGYPRGLLTAYIDHARGLDEGLHYGSLPPYEAEYRRLLRSRYGFEVRGPNSTFVPTWAASYMDGYNAVSHHNAIEKYGKDIFKECADEASASWGGK